MSGIRRERNIKIPKRNNKSQPRTTNYSPSRPAEGRRDIPKKVERKPQQQKSSNRNFRPNQNRRQNNQKKQKPRVKKPTPLDDENWARVVEHDFENNVLTLLGESKFLLGRYRPKHTNKVLPLGQRVYVGIDLTKRTEVGDMMGMARLDKMSSSADKDLPIVIQRFIEEHETYFIKSFYNPAGFLSLKQHSYELLHGIGNKKATQMVEQRGSSGFSSFEQLNDSCGVDAAELLAIRFQSELKDRTLQPRLTELLLPVKT